MTDPQNPGGWPDAKKPSIWVLAYELKFPEEKKGWPQAARRSFATEKEARAYVASVAGEGRYQVCRVELPAEVAAREAAARREGIEAAAKWHDEEGQRIADEAERFMPRENGFHERSAAAIRALLDDGR